VALAWINIVVHIVALAFAAVAMRPGSPSVPLDERMAYLAGHPAGWTIGWATWMACAAFDVALIAQLHARAPRRTRLGLAAILAAAIGAITDISCEVAHVAFLPRIAALASPAEPQNFLDLESMLWWTGAVIANPLYAVGVVLVTYALRPPTHVIALAWATLAAALAMAATVRWPALFEPASGVTIAVFVAWVFTATRASLAPRTA
jgi:hypothetical protein